MEKRRERYLLSIDDVVLVEMLDGKDDLRAVELGARRG